MSKIEWCDITINPIVGCSKCSPGCDHCYAERFAARMAKHPKPTIRDKYAGVVDERGKWTARLGGFHADVFDRLQTIKKPSRVFVCSMGDVFHTNVYSGWLAALFDQFRKYPQHTFILLTKRPYHAKWWFNDYLSPEKFPNVWLGVTVCNQQEADEKIPLLLQTLVAKRFVSVEPMLGPVDFTDLDLSRWLNSTAQKNALTGEAYFPGHCGESSRTIRGSKLDWVICGGETGSGARPVHPDWVRSLRDQCQGAGVPFFFKGWGGWRVVYDKDYSTFPLPRVASNERWLNLAGGHGFHGERVVLVSRKSRYFAGRKLDGREWNQAPI